MVFNAAVLTACPLVRVLWRSILRQKYLVKGIVNFCHRQLLAFQLRRHQVSDDDIVNFWCDCIVLSSSSLLLSRLELSDTQILRALNTSPPRNRCTFFVKVSSPFEVVKFWRGCTGVPRSQETASS
jgi:hypothetical protein